MDLRTFTVGQFQANCHLLTDPASGASVLVDVGEDASIARTLLALDPRPDLRAVLLTHAHLDHAGGLHELQQVLDVPAYLAAADEPLFRTLPQQGSWFGMPELNRPCGRIERWLAAGETLEFGGIRLQVLLTPGHAPGHACFHDGTRIFSGDLLFAGSIGRTDLPLGDPAEMDRSLRRILELDPRLRVHAGHGPDTSLERELASNPFLSTIRRERGLPGAGRGSWWG